MSTSSVAAANAPAPKKNTVDYIPSKLSYDTAIPVAILDDRADFIEKFKAFDIIDGKNPLDEFDVDGVPLSPLQNSARWQASLPGAPGDAAPRNGRIQSGLSIKEEQSELLEAESDDTQGNGKTETRFTRPSRSGWAQQRLTGRVPHQLLRSRDLESQVRYVLDDADYDWCAAQHVAPECLQCGMTCLEWAYVSSLLTATAPHVEHRNVTSLSSASVVGAVKGGAEPTALASFTSPVTVASPSSLSAALTLLQKRGAALKRHAAKDGHAKADRCTCALCSKPVQLLTSGARNLPLHSNMNGDATRNHRDEGKRGGLSVSTHANIKRGRGGRGGRGRARSAMSVTSTVAPPSGSSAAFDVSHDGLRCSECGVVAHLKCWFLTEPPRLHEAWVCDSCTNYAKNHRRSALMCAMCGRSGGVLLPYVTSLKDDGEALEQRSPLPGPPTRRAGFSSTVVLTDSLCHAVCALSMPELAIHVQDTVLRRSGLVDMEMRPYIYAQRRVGKHKYAMPCEFCQQGTGRCVQCAHAHCFETMHASCAAEAHTVDCHAELPFSPTGAAMNTVSHAASETNGRTTLFGPSLSSSLLGAEGWTGCSPYCRKHYGYLVTDSGGSAALSDRAEAEALVLDLTGLLIGGDGGTLPILRKRGRGRPPAAFVLQREAQRELIDRIRAYWLERRRQRRQVSAQMVGEINARLRPVVQATLRPEIMKISATKVRLSHFLSLVPEWQWHLISVVEGELPLPDDEYDDVQKYRKVAHTRRSGNTRSLYEKLREASTQLEVMCELTEAMRQECKLRHTAVDQELRALHLLCGWP